MASLYEPIKNFDIFNSTNLISFITVYIKNKMSHPGPTYLQRYSFHAELYAIYKRLIIKLWTICHHFQYSYNYFLHWSMTTQINLRGDTGSDIGIVYCY